MTNDYKAIGVGGKRAFQLVFTLAPLHKSNVHEILVIARLKLLRLLVGTVIMSVIIVENNRFVSESCS